MGDEDDPVVTGGVPSWDLADRPRDFVYRTGEYVADRCVHIAGVAAGTCGVLTLLIAAGQHGSLRLLLGVALYALGLLSMLFCSALYNMSRAPALKERYRRFDHAAIFIMIAGSYTPFLLGRMGGEWVLEFLAFVWLAAIAGAALAIMAPGRFERLQLAAYLVLGWCILVLGGRLIAAVGLPAAVLLTVGGLFYSVGVVFHLWQRLPYHNAIWHGFVLIGAGCHYAAVLVGVVLV
jgi:hemolysin III